MEDVNCSQEVAAVETPEFILDYNAGAEPVDEATLATLDAALEQAERGETVTLEQALENARENYQAWLKAQKEALPA